MAFCNMKNPPEYTTEIRKWDRETPADGQGMGDDIEQLFNNTYYNKKVREQHEQPVVVSLAAVGWSDTAPYSQRVAVPGVKVSDNPVVSPYTPKELEVYLVKTYRKMAAMITDGETEDGYVTFYCGEKRPTADFMVYLRGVSANG